MTERSTLVLVALLSFLLGAWIVASPASPVTSLEVKYLIVNSHDNSKAIEVVDRIWINGAPDYNNRPFIFARMSTVSLTAPESITTPWGVAHFAFWQLEDGVTYQGEIRTERTITVVLTGEKVIWWANYYL